MKDLTNNTKEALKASEQAAEKAMAALTEAQSNLNTTRNATAEVLENCTFADFTYFLSSACFSL